MFLRFVTGLNQTKQKMRMFMEYTYSLFLK